MNEPDSDIVSARSVVEAYCDAWLAGDTTTVLSLYHDDMVLEWPGRHRLAGVHEGLQASIDALLALQGLTNRVPTTVVDVVTGDHSVTATVVERWTEGEGTTGRSMDVVRGLEYTVEDGKLRTCRIHETDQSAVDEWIERAADAI